MAEEQEIGVITHYFGKVGAGIIKLSAPLKVGDKIHIKGHTSDFTETINSMQIEHEIVQEAKKGDEVGINVTEKVHEHDRVYKIVE